MTTPTKFHVGDRAEDVDTRKTGTIVHIYSRRELGADLVAIKFDD